MFLYLIMMLQICLGNMSQPLSTQCAIARCSRCFSSTCSAHSLSQGLLKHPPLLPLTLMDSGWDDAELRAEVKALQRRVTRKSSDGSAPSAATLKTLKPLASRRTSAKKKKVVQAAMKARKKRRPYHTARATSWLTCKLSGNKPIRLGTECSGLESVMVALNMMTSRTELEFICEKKGSGCTSADLGTHIPETCL